MTIKQNNFGLSEKSSMSYYDYLKNGLNIISPHLTIRLYKLAPKDKYPFFERDRDSYVKIFWKKEAMYEFVVENAFLYTSNTNKEDRTYMRNFAKQKLQMFKDAVERGKK